MRKLRVTFSGRAYDIPEAWLMGAERTAGSIVAAVRLWHEQAEMEAAFQRGE